MTDCPLPAPLAELEPALGPVNLRPIYLKERSVDPRALTCSSAESRPPSRGGHCFRDGRHRGPSGGWERNRSGNRQEQLFGFRGCELCGSMGRTVTAAAIPDSPGQRTDAVAGGGIARPGSSRHPRSRNLSGAAHRWPHPGGRDPRRGGIRRAHRHTPQSSACGGRRSAWFLLSPRRACSRPGQDCGRVLPITCL